MQDSLKCLTIEDYYHNDNNDCNIGGKLNGVVLNNLSSKHSYRSFQYYTHYYHYVSYIIDIKLNHNPFLLYF